MTPRSYKAGMGLEPHVMFGHSPYKGPTKENPFRWHANITPHATPKPQDVPMDTPDMKFQPRLAEESTWKKLLGEHQRKEEEGRRPAGGPYDVDEDDETPTKRTCLSKDGHHMPVKRAGKVRY